MTVTEEGFLYEVKRTLSIHFTDKRSIKIWLDFRLLNQQKVEKGWTRYLQWS